MNLIQSIKKGVNSFFTPQELDFQNHGLLGPEQFIKAGNQLAQCGWQWNASLTNHTVKCFLDPNKQYLSSTARSNIRIKNICNQELLKFQDDFTIYNNEESEILNIEDQRIYNMSITYDEYYHTPRFWLYGTVNGRPLTQQEIFEDIMAEQFNYNRYVNETVSVMVHPFLGFQQVSIHPCKHQETIKKFLDQAKENGTDIKCHQVIYYIKALILFLKIISGVIPTINHDFTTDLSLN